MGNLLSSLVLLPDVQDVTVAPITEPQTESGGRHVITLGVIERLLALLYHTLVNSGGWWKKIVGELYTNPPLLVG